MTTGGNQVANVCRQEPTGHLNHPVIGQLAASLPDGGLVGGKDQDDQAQGQGHTGGEDGEQGKPAI